MNKLNSRLAHHTPKYADAIGNFGLSYHLELIKDRERVSKIVAALDETLTKNGVHVELGAGTGIFSIYAAQRCRKVYAIERDPTIFTIAKRNVAKAGLSHKIELIQADAAKVVLPEKADTLLVEMMSTWGINEPQIPIMNYALKHILKEKGKPIPGRIVNVVELGYYDFDIMGVECKTSMAQFTGVTKPSLISNSHVFNEFDFTKSNPEKIDHAIVIPTLLSGVINCARLSSLVQLGPNTTFFSTDSLMPQTIVPLDELMVRAGEQIEFSATFNVRSNLDDSLFSIGKAN